MEWWLAFNFLRSDSVPSELCILSRDRTHLTNYECHDLLVYCKDVYLRCLSLACFQNLPQFARLYSVSSTHCSGQCKQQTPLRFLRLFASQRQSLKDLMHLCLRRSQISVTPCSHWRIPGQGTQIVYLFLPFAFPFDPVPLDATLTALED